MLDRLLALVHQHDRFLLSTHTRPDGDAIGSELAMGRFLEKLGKEVTILNSDPPPRTLEWLPGIEKAGLFGGTLAQRKAVAEAKVILVMDVNAADRLGDLAGPIQNSGALKVLIDHHTDPEGWFDLQYARDTAAATGQLVYEIICAEDAALIDAALATTLYTAIMTDTGSFRYNSVTPAVHRVVADLLECGGITPAPIHTALYDNRTLASVRLLGRALGEIALRYGGQIGYTVVTNDMLRAVGADTDDKEGIVSYVLSVEGVRAALIFSEASGGTKISFRSEGDVHVNGWARAFGGGGHRNASGAYVERPLAETIDAVLDAAPRYIGGLAAPAAAPAATDTLSEEDAALLAALKEQA